MPEDENIKRHFTVQETPQQNWVVEKINHTLLEKVRYLLSKEGMGKPFWAEALAYASHLINRLSSSTIGGKTPIKIWSRDATQDYNWLRVFGCPAYYHINDRRLNLRTKKGVFLGSKRVVKNYK